MSDSLLIGLAALTVGTLCAVVRTLQHRLEVMRAELRDLRDFADDRHDRLHDWLVRHDAILSRLDRPGPLSREPAHGYRDSARRCCPTCGRHEEP